MDLSQPRDGSINEYISKDDFSVKYTHFDTATDMVRAAGIGCFFKQSRYTTCIQAPSCSSFQLATFRIYVGGDVFH